MEIEVRIKDGENVVDKEVMYIEDDTPSMYARIFDEVSPYWRNSRKENDMFIRMINNHVNDLLMVRAKAYAEGKSSVKGHVYLNEVYELLGLPRAKYGYLIGWIFDENSRMSDNFIDFAVTRFEDSKKDTILLEFNVDGMIWNRIH